MPHLQKASELKQQCATTKNCEEYEAFVQNEYQKYDARSSQQINQTIVVGAALTVVVLLLAAVAFIAPLKRMASKVFSWVIVIAPVLIIASIAAGIGFGIAFGACFKQQCSSAENSAMFTLPLLSLVVSIPLAVLVNKKRIVIALKINSVHKAIWLAICLVLLTLIVSSTYTAVRSEQKSNQAQKEWLTQYDLDE